MKIDLTKKKNLAQVLKTRRLGMGTNGEPLGWARFGKAMGVEYTSLFRFCANDRPALGIGAIRKLVAIAKASDDSDMLMALAEYALNTDLSCCGFAGLPRQGDIA